MEFFPMLREALHGIARHLFPEFPESHLPPDRNSQSLTGATLEVFMRPLYHTLFDQPGLAALHRLLSEDMARIALFWRYYLDLW